MVKLEDESVDKEVFQNVFAAITFYLLRNPARAKYKNHLEPENLGRSDSFGELDPADIWADVCLALQRAEKEHEGLQWDCFNAYHIFRINIGDIAEAGRICPKTARRYVDRVQDTLEEDLVTRGLMAKPDKRFE